MLGAGEAHVLAEDLEERLVDRDAQAGPLAVDVEGQEDELDVALQLFSHALSSITFRALAHSHRSGTAACARVLVGGGSSG